MPDLGVLLLPVGGVVIAAAVYESRLIGAAMLVGVVAAALANP